jgi:hypothetical protein
MPVTGGPPMLNIESGEEIALMLVSQLVPGSGYFKLLAKKKKNSHFEWVHFVERLDKRKENVYTGEVKNEAELMTVLEIMNRNLTKLFGPGAEMKPGLPEFFSDMGKVNPATD